MTEADRKSILSILSDFAGSSAPTPGLFGPGDVVKLATLAADRRITLYLVGSDAELLGLAGHELAERTDFKLDVAGSAVLESDVDAHGAEAETLLARIAASGAELVLIALDGPNAEVLTANINGRCGPLAVAAKEAALRDLVRSSGTARVAARGPVPRK